MTETLETPLPAPLRLLNRIAQGRRFLPRVRRRSSMLDIKVRAWFIGAGIACLIAWAILLQAAVE